jgi:hypothetical protein
MGVIYPIVLIRLLASGTMPTVRHAYSTSNGIIILQYVTDGPLLVSHQSVTSSHYLTDSPLSVGMSSRLDLLPPIQKEKGEIPKAFLLILLTLLSQVISCYHYQPGE